MSNETLSQAEWERLVRVWRTRANQEFQRAERNQAAYKRAHKQANDALNRAAELQQHADQLQAALDQAQGRQTELEADNARLRSTLHYLNAEIFHAPEEIKAAGEWRTEIRTALAQQTDQPVASHETGNLSHNAPCVSQNTADQPAQGEAGERPDTAEQDEIAAERGYWDGYRAGAEAMRKQAARIVTAQGFRTTPSEKAQAILNLEPGDE